MLRRINLALCLSLALALACASSQSVKPNRYGLRVVPDRETYEKLARADVSKRMVDLAG